jgi:hypothetical protein
MNTTTKIAKRGRRLSPLALILGAAGCMDLDVVNTIDADQERALADPASVEALIGGAFYPNFFRPVHGSDGGLSGLVVSLWGDAGADFTATLAGTTSAVWYLDLVEPRPALENAASICATICQHGPRDFWARIQRVSSISYDGLIAINGGMVMRQGSVDVTPRAKAFAKFMQGWAWGYAALVFDKVNVVPETVPIPADPQALAELNHTSLVSYKDAIKAAIASLEEAIAIARQNPNVVSFPSAAESAFWFGTEAPVTNAQFIQWANTLAARLLVLAARTPEERQNGVDWQKVLQYTSAGISSDASNFEFLLSTTRSSQLLFRQQSNTSTGTTNARWNYRAIGPADQSGAYQAWINGAANTRNRFNIVTPDRRITGATPTSNGSYTRYRADNNGFLAERGLYLFSAYQWTRHQNRFNLTDANRHQAGTAPMITADENKLLRAEALLRTNGSRDEAVALINVTRTRAHLGSSLPPLTVSGVPTVNGTCVPRTDAGVCGTLMTALRYERMIELAGMDAIRGYAESRGFGLLADGSLLQFPVPGNILDLYGLPIYTFGGMGKEGAATYKPLN